METTNFLKDLGIYAYDQLTEVQAEGFSFEMMKEVPVTIITKSGHVYNITLDDIITSFDVEKCDFIDNFIGFDGFDQRGAFFCGNILLNEIESWQTGCYLDISPRIGIKYEIEDDNTDNTHNS